MAVVGPVRTLLVAHLQASWNRSRKELGKSGRVALYIAITVLAIFAAVPMILGGLVGGYFLGRGLPDPAFVRAIGGILALLGLVGGVVGGLFGGTQALGWESTRSFPLRLRSLFLAELIAGMGDAVSLVFALIPACLLLGVGVAKPLLLPVLPLVWLGTMAALLSLKYLAGSLSARLAKHLRLALAVLGILFWVSTSLMPRFAAKVAPKGRTPTAISAQLEHALEVALRIIDALPSTQCVRGMAGLLNGQWGQALGRQAYPIAVLALLLLAAARTLRRDSDPQAFRSVATGSVEKLWSFAAPAHGVARLQWKAVLSSHLGKFQLLIPMIALVLLKGPLGAAKGAALWGVPAAFAYLSMGGMQTQLNQFGLDGAGIKALLLLPVQPRDLLLGKTLGLLAYLAMQVALLLVLLRAAGSLGFAQALACVCLAGCQFLAQVSLGHWTSAWLPRPMPRDSLKNNNMAQPVVWLGMAGMATSTMVFGGSFLLTAWLAPGLLLPIMAGLLGLMILAYWHLILPNAARFLAGRREVLVQALG